MKNILFCFIVLASLFSCGEKKEHVQPVVGEITESVYASGRVKAKDQFNVYSTVNGILLHVAVEPGDSVSIGDTLFILDNLTSRLNSANSMVALEYSKENNKSGSDKLLEMEFGVRQTYDRYLLDSSIYGRQKKLWDMGIGSKNEFEQKELVFKTSRNAYQSAESKFSQLRSQLQNELKRSEINYDLSKKVANDYIIRSAMDGLVYDVQKEENELITTQTSLAVLGRKDSFYVELEVDEYDIAKIEIGQKILITMDSYQSDVFEGAVSKIYPIMNERTRTFTVEAQFTKAPSNLYPYLTAESNVIIQTKPSALTIPRKYLSEGKYVYTSEKEKVEVKVGLMDYEKAEILSGLESSQEIYLPPAK